jgi:hypothetical protein
MKNKIIKKEIILTDKMRLTEDGKTRKTTLKEVTNLLKNKELIRVSNRGWHQVCKDAVEEAKKWTPEQHKENEEAIKKLNAMTISHNLK